MNSRQTPDCHPGLKWDDCCSRWAEFCPTGKSWKKLSSNVAPVRGLGQGCLPNTLAVLAFLQKICRILALSLGIPLTVSAFYASTPSRWPRVAILASAWPKINGLHCAATHTQHPVCHRASAQAQGRSK